MAIHRPKRNTRVVPVQIVHLDRRAPPGRPRKVVEAASVGKATPAMTIFAEPGDILAQPIQFRSDGRMTFVDQQDRRRPKVPLGVRVCRDALTVLRDEILCGIDRQSTCRKYEMPAIGDSVDTVVVYEPLAILRNRQVGDFLQRQEAGQIQLNGTVGTELPLFAMSPNLPAEY